MKTIVNKVTIKLFAFLIIGIMGMLIANKAVFTHTHILNDGTIIVHSHPYDKSADPAPYKSHHHTKTELLFAQSIDTLFLFIFVAYVLFAFVKKVNFTFYLRTRYSLSCIILHKGRAPPIS